MEKAIDYDVLEAHKIATIQDDLTQKLVENKNKSGSRIDSLRQAILDYVVSGNYDVAREELEGYIQSKREYPEYIARAERYKVHCIDLISAIKAKRSFPGISTLSLSKQQEIHEKVLSHFEELKQGLKHIEVMEKEQKLTDIRSTVWVLKALSYSAFGLFGLGLTLDLFLGMGHSMNVVYSALVDDLLQFLVNLI